EILDVARIDGGVMTIDLQAVDLVALLREAGAALATPDQPVVVKASQDVVALADAARIRQCVDNLLANAIKHSPHGAGVTVQVDRFPAARGEAARVEIIDQGPGVEPALLPHVFERFVTGDRRTGGLGLGLYLAKRIAVLHGGDLTVASPPGSGARFILTLP